MEEFTRNDHRSLRVVEGFRDFLLHYRPSTTPREDWTEAQYLAAALKKRSRAARLVDSFRYWLGSLDDIAVLDVACGDGSNCLALGEQPARIVVGIDLDLPMFSPTERGERTRKLATHIAPSSPSRLDRRLHFAQMDATSLGFANDAFDLLMSRSATEHIRPIDSALAEMVRVVRDGGLIYLGIDPYYWVRGCHKRGIVDIPWAHARLTMAEYRRFVVLHEGDEIAAQRCQRLESLNRLTLTEWRRLIEQLGCEILEWNERHSVVGEQVIAQMPEVLETLLPGVTEQDLFCERIEVWLRKRR